MCIDCDLCLFVMYEKHAHTNSTKGLPGYRYREQCVNVHRKPSVLFTDRKHVVNGRIHIIASQA